MDGFSLFVLSMFILCMQFIAVVLPWSREPNYEIEVCNDHWISAENISGLHYAFRKHLFGQHMVEEQLTAIMHGFFRDKNPERPLVLSFHGMSGTGKNHVSRLIAQSIYKKGMDSKFVHIKLPQNDYPNESDLDRYKEALQKEIQTSVAQCGRQLFIFDEIEHLPEGLLKSIKPYVDYHDKVGGVDYKKSIFIFLTMVAGREISEILLNHNSTRDTLRIRNFDKVIERVSFNTKDSGLYRSGLLDSNLISHYIPFLPLERKHVKLCIREESIKTGLYPLSDEVIDDIMDELHFWPEDTQTYAFKGCKIREKLNLYAYTKKKNEL